MKYLLITFAILIVACNSNYPTPFHKMEGNWVRVNTIGHIKTFEQWEISKNSNDTKVLLTGMGQTYKSDSLVFQENLSIFQYQGNKYQYVVDGVNADTTFFEITQWNDNSFLAINEENEFPKYIAYRFTTDSMLATISDGATSINFDFVRKP